MPMYSLASGDASYLFESSSALPKAVERDTSYTWAKQDRLGRAPAQQALSPGLDKIKMDGVLFPSSRSRGGGKAELVALRALAADMQPLLLVDGNGWAYGKWVIKNIAEGRSHLWPNSDPRKISYTIELEAYGGDAA